MKTYFADTGYFIALLSADDSYHAQATMLAEKLARLRASVITTDAILIETLDGLARHRRRRLAAAFISELEGDPDVEIVATSMPRFRDALALFNERTDKTWSMTDCISFVVMRERKMTLALAADKHFQQAGFQALLIA